MPAHRRPENQTSALDPLPADDATTALTQAAALQTLAEQAGFVWKSHAAAFSKLEEELDEFRHALTAEGPHEQEDELGDVLFCLINYARLIGLDAEAALKKANIKFERRFRGMEVDLKQAGHTNLKDISADLYLDYWNKQKNKEKPL